MKYDLREVIDYRKIDSGTEYADHHDPLEDRVGELVGGWLNSAGFFVRLEGHEVGLLD